MLNYVKITTILNPLELLAPHSCRCCGRLGSPLCNCCKNYIITHHANFCPTCKAPNPTGQCPSCKHFTPTYAIGFRNKLLDRLIHDFKYQSVRALGPTLAELMHATLPTFSVPTIIVPIPTAAKHVRARGLDHTKILAKHLARLRHCQTQPLLLRDTNTVQVGSNRQTRLAQAEQAFSVNPKISLNPSINYLLIDDVWTTGASLNSATKKLQQAGAKHITIAVLAISR